MPIPVEEILVIVPAVDLGAVGDEAAHQFVVAVGKVALFATRTLLSAFVVLTRPAFNDELGLLGLQLLVLLRVDALLLLSFLAKE